MTNINAPGQNLSIFYSTNIPVYHLTLIHFRLSPIFFQKWTQNGHSKHTVFTYLALKHGCAFVENVLSITLYFYNIGDDIWKVDIRYVSQHFKKDSNAHVKIVTI